MHSALQGHRETVGKGREGRSGFTVMCLVVELTRIEKRWLILSAGHD